MIATGEHRTVRDFVEIAAAEIDLKISWSGAGVAEKGHDQNGNWTVTIDPRYFRPAEVDTLLGDASKAKRLLGWSPRTSFRDMAREMMIEDLKEAQRDALVREHGFKYFAPRE